MPLAQNRRVAKPVGQHHTALIESTVDLILLAPLFDQLDCRARLLIKPMRTLGAKIGQQAGLGAGKPSEYKAAVAPRGTKADLIGLDQHHALQTALGAAKQGVQAGEAAANNAHRGLFAAAQGRTDERRAAGRLVVRTLAR